jgi:hypothetical protein
MNKYSILIMISLCSIFYSCTNDKKYKEYRIIDLTKPITDTLNFENKDRVTGVEIIVLGSLKGNAIIEFENGAGRYSKIDLKDKVNQKYETEWYSSKLTFRYTPISVITGDSLILKYRMY